MSKKTPKKTPKKTARKAASKTRKTSPKPASAKVVQARPKASAKTPAAKKTAANARKRPAKVTAAASQKAPSKPLKPPHPRESAGKSALAEGARAPAFRLPRDGGDSVALADYSGRKLVLFFYPRADTPGCTREAIDFTRLASAFAASQTAILGVSADPPKAQEAFRDKHQLSTALASDEQHGMLEAYDVWGEKSMYGKTFMGIVRTTVLIGTDGQVLRIWRHVKVDGHADEVLAAVRAL